MKQDILNWNNEKVGTIELADDVFGVEVRADVLSRVVNWQLARVQSGNHRVKTRGEVNRTGAKAFKQKGSGRARSGSRTVSHHRGGGVVFGPVVRDHSFELTKKFRKLGLKTALSAKAKDGNLIIVENAKTDSAKTKELNAKFEKLGIKTALIVDDVDVDFNFALASRNIVGVDVLPEAGANVYDILRREKLVMTQEAAKKLEARLK